MQIVVAETYSKAQLHAKYVVSRKLHAKNMNSRKVQGTVGMRRDPPRTAGGNPLELGSGDPSGPEIWPGVRAHIQLRRDSLVGLHTYIHTYIHQVQPVQLNIFARASTMPGTCTCTWQYAELLGIHGIM